MVKSPMRPLHRFNPQTATQAAFRRWLRAEEVKIGLPRTFLNLACVLANLGTTSAYMLPEKNRDLLRHYARASIKFLTRDRIRGIMRTSALDQGFALSPHAPDVLRNDEAELFNITDDRLCELLNHANSLFRSIDDPYVAGVTIRIVANDVMLRFTDEGFEESFLGDLPTIFLLNAMTELRRRGFRNFRRCPTCSSVFFAQGRKLFCSRSCLDERKNLRNRRSADYKEDKAMLMWRKAFRTANKRDPSPNALRTWLDQYRKKRLRFKRAVSKRPIEDLQKKL